MWLFTNLGVNSNKFATQGLFYWPHLIITIFYDNFSVTTETSVLMRNCIQIKNTRNEYKSDIEFTKVSAIMAV